MVYLYVFSHNRNTQIFETMHFFKVQGEIDIIMEAHSNMNLLTKMHTTLLFISREEKIKFMHILTK